MKLDGKLKENKVYKNYLIIQLFWSLS